MLLKLMKLRGEMGGVAGQRHCRQPAMGHADLTLLDLGRGPYVLYGVKYIDLVSLW